MVTASAVMNATTPCLRITTADAPLLHRYSLRRIVLLVIGLPMASRSLLAFALPTLTGAHFPSGIVRRRFPLK
ncbi:hypothetical protein [Pseudomonas lini]